MSDSERFLNAIRGHCMAKPGAVEDYPWGDTVWKVGGKLFAGWGDDPPTVGVKSTLEKQAVLIQDPAISVAKYVGKYGWVNIEIDDETLPMALDLVDESYDQVVAKLPKKLVPK